MDFAFAIKTFSALFAIINPIAGVPIFLSLTAGMAPADLRRTAILVTISVAVGSVISVLAGTAILNFFGLDVNNFRLAGGLVVLIIALSLLNGESSATHSGSPEEQKGFKAASNVAFYPLSFPLLLGPGSIATIVVYAHEAKSSGNELALWGGLIVFLAVLGAMMISAPFIGRVVSPTVMSVTKRLMGMILAAIGVDMMTTSLASMFPGWVH
jgi:multiple antibiotic resistance protein